MTTTIIATVKHSKPVFSVRERERLNNVFAMNEGKEVQITVGKVKKHRSNNQNSYYWGVPLKMIADFTGHTEEEINYEMKKQYAPKKLVKIGNIEELQPKGTSEMTTIEFEEFVEKVRIFASKELSIYIPNPNENIPEE